MKLSINVLFILILMSISIFSRAKPLIALETLTLNGNVYSTILNGKNDTLTFRDGLFHSNLFTERGFDKGEYTTVTKDNEIWFKAKLVNPDEEEIIWTGVIAGGAISGSYLYTKKGWFLFGDTTKRKNFKGNLKTNQKP